MPKAKAVASKPMVPALQIFISDRDWPNMELLVTSDTGKTWSAVAMFDIAPSQFVPPIMNALRENLTASIDLAKRTAKAKEGK